MSETRVQLDLSDRLRESERRVQFWQRQYQLLCESLSDAVYLQSESGDLVSTNAAGERLSGYPRDQIQSMNICQLLTAESCAPVMSLLEHARRGDRFFETEAEILTRSGTIQPVVLEVSILDERDCPVMVQYLARKAVHPASVREQRHNETRFRLMAKNLTEMVLAFDMERRLTFANAAVETLTGYSAEELEKRQFICWVHPEDRERMLGHWDRLYEGKSFFEEEYRLITKDDRMKWVAASWGPIVDDTGHQIGVQGRERDITDRRMAEETLRQSERGLRVSEERYRTLFEESPFPMWEEDFSRVKTYLDSLIARGVTDLRRYLSEHREALMECVRRVRVMDVNRAARNFYGASAKEELLVDLTQIFDEAAYEIFCDEMAVLVETNSLFRTEFQTRTLGGEERYVAMIVSLAETPNRDWSRAIVSFFDITDRKHLEEQVLQSQKLESLGRLAGGIAHDFNNLLTVINGYSDLLLHGADAANPMRHGLQEIHSAGLRGAELTQQLLAFSRKQVAQLRPMNLNAVVQEFQGMLHRVIGEDIQLVVNLDPSVGSVKADRGQIHQVLMNLVVNGREAMPKGGTLTIESQSVLLAPGLQETTDPTGRPYAVLRIGDTGVGMDVRTRQRVFEPFFTTKHMGKGTGLGLSTVFGIVTQSGGHISVASEPGCGTVFSIYLPHLTGPVRSDTAASPRRQPARGSGAILVVEDQPEVRGLTCMVLRGLGYEVLEAASGNEAIAIAADPLRQIRLLLTDVIMPEMNGKDLATALTTTQPGMKVLYMSGYTDRIMSETGVLDNSVAFLQKPFTPDKLTEIVQKILV
ncbi:MAG TPA: PAS domain S-box protein [Bryobacteraceae bacterium]|nr:PAS domain S-box protein [Bryobacteraceae bacterium]